jgi:hypothetical protein
MIKPQFLSHEHAQIMIKLGFSDPCIGFYDKNGKLGLPDTENGCVMIDYPPGKVYLLYLLSSSIIAPTYQQAFKWFWEHKGLFSEIFIDDNKTFGYMISYFVPEGRADKPIERGFATPELAEEACIKKLIQTLNL